MPGGDDVSQQHARAVIDVALRIGEAMLTTGASASVVVDAVLRFTHAYGMRSTHVDVTFTSLTVSMHRGLDEDPLTVMRVVRLRTLDYSRLESVQRLVDLVEDSPKGGMPDIADVRSQLAAALSAPHPYSLWVVTLGQALIGAGVVVLFGGGFVTCLLAGLSAAVVYRMSLVLARWGFAPFFVQVLGAALPTVVAVGLYLAEDRGFGLPGAQAPSLVAIAGIVVLLAGLTVVGAAQDAIDGNYVTASARGLEVVVLTVGIAIGISTVLGFAQRLQVPIEMSGNIAVISDPVLGTLAAAGIGAGFALSTYTRVRASLIAGLMASLVWAIYVLVARLELENSVSVAIAAAAAGALGVLGHSRLRVPELAMTTAAIVALLPGLAVYRGLYLLIDQPTGRVGPGLSELVAAMGIGMGLAAGVSAGGYVARRKLGLTLVLPRGRRRPAA